MAGPVRQRSDVRGALHESSKTGRLWLSPPKTEESARRVTLPPFLVRLLRRYLTTHEHPHEFPTPDRQLHRRSNFARRAMRPAADGNHDTKKPKIRTHPIYTGLTFHGLRHGHKTWMIADGFPDVGQARRLGHKLTDKIEEIYSHLAAEVENASSTPWKPVGQTRSLNPGNRIRNGLA